MKRLVFNGKAFAFVETFDPVAPPVGDVPKNPQKVKLRRVRPERLALMKPITNDGNGYRPGPLIDLGPDQCRYTLKGKTMCGAKCGSHSSWCEAHAAVVFRGIHAFDSVRMKEIEAQKMDKLAA